jgi:hypothetical protein
MPKRSLSLVTQTASRPFDPETGSQTPGVRPDHGGLRHDRLARSGVGA